MPATLSRYQKICFTLVAAMLLIVSAQAICSAADELKQEVNAAISAVRPTLIRIIVVAADYRQGREMKTQSAGSGVIISPDGYAVTNHHVAMNAKHMVCTLADKREVEATLIGSDALSDVAVIKLKSPDGKPFPTAEFGDSSTLEVGDRVFAMGSPLALSQSVTMGIVSNTEMMMPEDFSAPEMTLEGEDVGSIVKWIGHDALIEPGNSGGPLVSREGKIVGLNEISFGLSGAIPSNLVKRIADQLIQNGTVKRSWIGTDVQPLLESSKLTKGILVSNVAAGSPASKAGMKSGDVILSIDGTETNAQFKEQIPMFNQFIADIPVGKTIQAKVLRNGSEMTFAITTAEREKALDKECELKNWGICASNITTSMQMEMQLHSTNGIYISGILPSGPSGSAKPTLQEGDVIVKIGNDEVKNLTDLRTVTQKLTDEKKDALPVLVSFVRDEKQYMTVVKVGKEESSESGAEISKAWLPIDIQVLTSDLAKALGVPGKTGVRVTQIYDATKANKTGLKVGDLILKLDGEAIAADQLGDEEVLPSLIRQYDIGSKVKLAIVRDGKPLTLEVKLETSPKSARDFPKYEEPNIEYTARDIAFSDQADGEVDPGQTGVYVESVVEGSSASLAKLSAGDVITKIDTTEIKRLEDLKQSMQTLAKTKPTTMVIEVRRGARTMFLEVKPDWTGSGQ